MTSRYYATIHTYAPELNRLYFKGAAIPEPRDPGVRTAYKSKLAAKDIKGAKELLGLCPLKKWGLWFSISSVYSAQELRGLNRTIQGLATQGQALTAKREFEAKLIPGEYQLRLRFKLVG